MTAHTPPLGLHLGQKLLRFYRHWTLPLAIIAGTLAYLLAKHIPSLQPYRGVLLATSERSMPILIFTMLLLTFSRVTPTDLRPRQWQWVLMGVQTALAAAVVVVARSLGLSGDALALAQGLLVCLVAPTATAASVVVSKLATAADAGAVSVHALLQGALVSALVALLLPYATQGLSLSPWQLGWPLLTHTALLLLLPLAVAWILRYTCPRLHASLAKRAGWSFYLWSLALALVTAKTLRLIDTAPPHTSLLCHAGMALLACVLSFGLGRAIGRHYGAEVAAGQALGQKNTIFAIWLAYAFLYPTAALAPGAYVVWQNMFNAWQLWRARQAIP